VKAEEINELADPNVDVGTKLTTSDAHYGVTPRGRSRRASTLASAAGQLTSRGMPTLFGVLVRGEFQDVPFN